MALRKSLEYSEVFTAMLCDVQTLHSNVFPTSDLHKTIKRLKSRISSEGLSFLTKTLPRLGKAFDRALAGGEPLHASKYGFKPASGCQYPKFLGELFGQVLSVRGVLLPNADATCVKSIRQLLYVFYKLELPYDDRLNDNVVDKFVKTELDVKLYNETFQLIADSFHKATQENCDRFHAGNYRIIDPFEAYNTPRLEKWQRLTILGARKRLNRLFSGFNVRSIWPKHGPGVVSTKEQPWDKFVFRHIPRRLTDMYPIDEYFHSSVGHVCDSYTSFEEVDESEIPARVILVPKDSRGPRLISCESLPMQYIQQGLKGVIVPLVENHPLTKESVRFTDQLPNQFGALLGSITGKYATLDLNEASDRVSVGLVRLLFPEPLLGALLASRSLSTVLPDGTELKLHKFAPMGSALCFPILALTIWSLLDAGLEVLTDADSEKPTIYVYGDDVIVPTANAEHAICILESFGLKLNRDKSCTSGSFRESCGCDAFKGVRVEPLRVKKVWTSTNCPESYVSWIAYANSFYAKKYYATYEYIVERIIGRYGPVPSKDLGLSAPSLAYVPDQVHQKLRRRTNLSLQRQEWRVLDVLPLSIRKILPGWNMLLRFFTEGCSDYEASRHTSGDEKSPGSNSKEPFSVSVYTKRGATALRWCWKSKDVQHQPGMVYRWR